MESTLIFTRDKHSATVNAHAAPIASPSGSEVLVRFHFSPVNPLDIAVIAGTYPVKPHFEHNGESILGFDGIAEVAVVGPAVTRLHVGDLVIPARYGIGTWRSHAVLDESLLDRIPKPHETRFGGILRLGVASAYFLVENMCKLRPGEWIIQNAGASVTAQMVVQFARRKGINVLSVIRDRKEPHLVMEALVGNKDKSDAVTKSEVVTESELAEAKKGRQFKMAIDSVGGFSGQQVLDCLSTGATFVQHGFLAGTENILPLNAASFWARHLQMRSSRSSAEMAALSDVERQNLFAWVVELANRGELQMPALGLEDVAIDAGNTEGSKEAMIAALSKARKGRLGQRKQVIAWI